MAGASVNLSLRDRMKRALLAMNFVLKHLPVEAGKNPGFNIHFSVKQPLSTLSRGYFQSK